MDDVPEVVPEVKVVPGSSAALIRQVERVTQRKFSAEDKIRIVFEGFRKEQPLTDLCRHHGLSPAVYYGWLKHASRAIPCGMRPVMKSNSCARRMVRKELLGQTALELALFKKSLDG